MENKTTTELLDLLRKIERKADKDPDGEIDWDEHAELYAKLCKRTPFRQLLGTNDDPNDLTHEEQLEAINEEMKRLKRHKHDEHSGDVLVRI